MHINLTLIIKINCIMEENYSKEENLNMGNEAPITIGNWFVTILLLGIPIVNIIMLLVWAFSGDYSKTKSNFAKAYLIWFLIGIVLSGIFLAIFGSILLSSYL